jgi:hypothetical protein
MNSHRGFLLAVGVVVLLSALVWVGRTPLAMLWFVLTSDREGYPVSFTPDEVYTVEGLTLGLEHSTIRVPSGVLIRGITPVGTTEVMVLGDGLWQVDRPAAYRWVDVAGRDSSSAPFGERFTSLYLRIHPRFYDHLVAGARLLRTRDDEAFARGLQIRRHKFWNYYHVNERATIPSANVGAVDLESVTWGRLQIHEETRALGVGLIRAEVRCWDYQGDPPSYLD